MPADRLLSVYCTGFGPASALPISGEEALAVRREVKGLGNTSLLRWNDFNVSSHSCSATGRAERVSGLLIYGDPFRLLNWPMALGRGFVASAFRSEEHTSDSSH